MSKDTFRAIEFEIASVKSELKEKEDFINKYATDYAREKGYVAKAEEKVQKLRSKLEMLMEAYSLLVRAANIN